MRLFFGLGPRRLFSGPGAIKNWPGKKNHPWGNPSQKFFALFWVFPEASPRPGSPRNSGQNAPQERSRGRFLRGEEDLEEKEEEEEEGFCI